MRRCDEKQKIRQGKSRTKAKTIYIFFLSRLCDTRDKYLAALTGVDQTMSASRLLLVTGILHPLSPSQKTVEAVRESSPHERTSPDLRL